MNIYYLSIIISFLNIRFEIVEAYQYKHHTLPLSNYVIMS